jgi:hypothetical protein
MISNLLFIEREIITIKPFKFINRNKKQPDDEWYTPEFLIKALKETSGVVNFQFDLDPASSNEANEMTQIAKRFFTKDDQGELIDWPKEDYIFLNPPFQLKIMEKFVHKMAKHGNGILLVADRLEALTRRVIEPNVMVSLHFRSKLPFLRCGKGLVSGAPFLTVLYAFGEKAAEHLIKLRDHKEIIPYEPYLNIHEKGLILIKKEIGK